MLNEIYEYDQYMTRVLPDHQENEENISVLTPAEFIKKYGTRLGYRRLVSNNKNPDGLKRPLLLIARECLFTKSDREDIKRCTVECLKAWCGMDAKINPEYKDNPCVRKYQDLLPEYMESVLGHGRDDKGQKAVKERCTDITRKDWGRAGFDLALDKSDYHGIRFERIVAEALVCNDIAEKGLDRYYLLSTQCSEEDEIFKDVFWNYDKNKANADLTSGKSQVDTKKRKNRILMMVAVKLMKERTEHSRWFPKCDFENWIQESSGNSYKLNLFKYMHDDGSINSLFREKKLISTQEDKELVVDAIWNSKCGWKVVTREELLEFIKKENRIPLFYRDYYYEEDGVILQKNKFYTEKEEVSFWKEAARENELLTQLCKCSFGGE